MGAIIGLLVLLAASAFGQPGEQVECKAYILGAYDQVTVRVLDLEEFNGGGGANTKEFAYRFDLRGMMNLPMIGRMKAAGQTVEQLEAGVAERLKEYLKTPSVTVAVVEYKIQPISVIGQVTPPGVHQLQGRKTLLQVILAVGGLKPDSGHQIKITRKIEYGAIPLASAKTDQTGAYSVAEISVKRIMNAQSPEENIQIQPFDVISVPKAELVYVVGNVKKSCGFILGDREGVTALRALSIAEGLDKEAAGTGRDPAPNDEWGRPAGDSAGPERDSQGQEGGCLDGAGRYSVHPVDHDQETGSEIAGGSDHDGYRDRGVPPLGRGRKESDDGRESERTS